MQLDGDSADDLTAASAAEAASVLDVAGAWTALGLSEGATLADVRAAYRALTRYHHPQAQRGGDGSAAAMELDRLLEALELLEEHLVPTTALAGEHRPAAVAAATRKRATPRSR